MSASAPAGAAVTGIDHAVVIVRDIARAAAAWRALGFTLTPEGRHTVLQSVNHCIMFGEDYIELLAFVGEHPSRRYLLDFLARREGMGALALKSAGIEATVAAWQAAGLPAGAPIAFGRPVERGGVVRQAAFRTSIIAESATPPGRTFACQHFTPELVWLPEYQTHANGAQAIAAVLVAVGDVAATTALFARVLGVAPSRADATMAELPAGGGVVRVLAQPAFAAAYPEAAELPAPCYAGVQVKVADRSRAAAVLDAAGIAWRRRGPGPAGAGGGTVVAPAAACGALVEFV